MAFTVVYDACVLYPAPLRDLLMRIAASGIVRARWTEQILDECFASISRNRPDLKPKALARTRKLMIETTPDCLITGYESLAEGITLPDSKDRHVLAAAIKAGAQAILTWNRRDFPDASLEPYQVRTLDPDEFVLDAIDLAPGLIVQILEEQSSALRNPPMNVLQVLAKLRDCGLAQSVAKLRDLGLE